MCQAPNAGAHTWACRQKSIRLQKKLKIQHKTEMSVQGVKSFWSGSQYDGEMLKGKRHGRGTKKWPNGDIYEGIRAQRPRKPAPADRPDHAWLSLGHMPACCICPGSGVRCTGEWRFDKKDGRGKMTDVATGASYEGEWRAGSKHGKGTIMLGKGDVYEGEWDCDRYADVRARPFACVRARTRGRAPDPRAQARPTARHMLTPKQGARKRCVPETKRKHIRGRVQLR